MLDIDYTRKISEAAYERERKRLKAASGAKVKWRVKGRADGHVYQGQHIFKKCKTCGGASFDSYALE